MITFPNAKINLGLNIVERRADGYHNLETVFYPIPLTDVLEIVPAAGADSTLTCYGNAVDCPVESNLVMRAYRLLQREYAVPPVDIFLYKHIPDGAGLGGGSSDAAHTLTMLNAMFDLGLSPERLAHLAATLGADCPFFIYNRPMQATGIGDVLTPVEVALSGMTLVLVKPPVSVPTKQAYAHVTPQAPALLARDVVKQPIPMWDGALKNDFEPSVFGEHPRLWLIKAALLDAGAQYAAMSGSGSAIFGIFDSANLAEGIADTMADCAVHVMTLP
jgi:4-diphosphocytidyl-2-C-methyl-D-erythritol kinase